MSCGGCARRRAVIRDWMLDHPTVIRAACAVGIAAAIALYALTGRAQSEPAQINWLRMQTCVGRTGTTQDNLQPRSYNHATPGCLYWQDV